jgi:hypothetical protein
MFLLHWLICYKQSDDCSKLDACGFGERSQNPLREFPLQALVAAFLSHPEVHNDQSIAIP